MSDTAPANDPADVKPRTFEGDFDEEKAKRLIANLDSEIATLKGRVSEVESERDEFKAAAEKTGTDRDEALAKALERAETAERDLAIRKHNLPDDVVAEFADYLTGSAEEVDAKAAKLAARLAPAKESSDSDEEKETDPEGDPETPPADTPPATPPQRPRARLTPGHGDEGGKAFDAKALAKSIRG